MYRLLQGLWGLFIVFGLSAGQQPPEKSFTNLVCILDRNAYGPIPAGSLYAVMGEFEACMLSFAVALSEREPILISDHIVKNVYDMLKFRGRADRSVTLNRLVSAVPDTVKSQYFNQDSEVQKAARWLKGVYVPCLERLVNFKKVLKFKDTLLNKSTVLRTKASSLHMLLILPKKGATENDLRAQGFVPSEFESLSKNVIEAFFANLYDSSAKVTSMAQPLDMNSFGSLFIPNRLLGRNIFLFGHGNVGVLAQLSDQQFRQLIGILNTVGCASLSIFSCHGGAQKNLVAYQGVSNFLKIAFSVGDIVAYAWCLFDATKKKFSLSTFFVALREYLLQKDLSSPDAVRMLCDAVAAIHVNDMHNYPWFCFPNSSTLIHLSELVEKIKKPAQQSDELLPIVQASSIITAESPGFAVDKDMGVITKEGYEAAVIKGEELIFENKRALLLHVQSIMLPIKFLNSVPAFLSMIDVPFYSIDTLDMNRLFFNTLLERLVSLRKICAIKNLLCMNYPGSNIAQNRSGQLLYIKDCIIEPVADTRFNKTALIRALFRLDEGPYYILECFVEHERLKKIVRREGTQAGLEAEHTRSIWQFFGLQKNSPFAQQMLSSIAVQRGQSVAAQAVPEQVDQSQPYIERMETGESLAKRSHRL